MTRVDGPDFPRWAVPKTVIEGGRTRSVHEAWCVDCGASARLRANTADLSLIKNNYAGKGWILGDGPIRCPACAEKARQRPPKKERKPLMPAKSEPRAAVVEPTAETTVEEAARIVRKINEVFADGRYLDGWSDRKIATALDVAPAKVSKAREMFIGPIKEDPAITALRSDVEAVEGMLSGIKARLAELAEAA